MQKQTEHGLKSTMRVFWRSYGGWRGIVCSSFFWISLLLLVISSNYWLNESWWEQVISVLPNLIGFTLGGFAIFLAFGDEKFRSLISGVDEEEEDGVSPFMEVSATFLFFVLIQVVALIFAILCNACNFQLPETYSNVSQALSSVIWIANMIGYWLFLYGLCLAAAAALAIFKVCFWFDLFNTNKIED